MHRISFFSKSAVFNTLVFSHKMITVFFSSQTTAYIFNFVIILSATPRQLPEIISKQNYLVFANKLFGIIISLRVKLIAEHCYVYIYYYLCNTRARTTLFIKRAFNVMTSIREYLFECFAFDYTG